MKIKKVSNTTPIKKQKIKEKTLINYRLNTGVTTFTLK